MTLTYRCSGHGTTATVDTEARRVHLELPPPVPGNRHFPQCALALTAHRALDDPDAPLGEFGPRTGGAHPRQCVITREGA